ncbi:autophagy protein 17 [Hypocenomyce scalaris]|nr:autophagy protein 17 [Hypocenomyce scalaris]
MSSSTESLPHSPPPEPSSALESLVSHLLASKRALSSINHVWRANELVTSTRACLETAVITSARTSFLRRGISSQLDLLYSVQSCNEEINKGAADEFKDAIKGLDEAEARLRGTLDLLRGIMVGWLRGEEAEGSEGEERRCLLDFVDETGVEGVMGAIKELIDGCYEARREFEESNASLEKDVHGVKTMLKPKTRRLALHSQEIGALSSPIPDILRGIEERAKDLAENLEMLVKHFDLCVKAIKHIEGGGAAAQRITGDLPEGVMVGTAGEDPPPEPMSDEERKEMMEVLEKDASEVEDVVMEIRDHIAEMESQYELATADNDRLAEEYSSTTAAFRLLEEVGVRLPTYITQSQVFLMRWDEEKLNIQERVEELEGMREFYDGFVRAYDNLIIEIDRRKTMQSKMEKVVEDAMARIERLYEEDARKREVFKQEQGDFLPIDIWPGLTAVPVRYEVIPVDKEAGSVPDVSESIIQQATRRLNGRRLE